MKCGFGQLLVFVYYTLI